ncbi:hypothetical protein [Photobacterium leiognathi]|uniref:hypothetical protein n=1 Tax=Photobacterium leiognathi TaxID=553611 RepID=UPI00273A1DBD|nr:hypothetical protein [Photobacterium leiognathi]
MEPWSSFATIIGLISAFKSEGRARSDDEYKELIEWLEKKRHTKVVEELNNNQLLSMQIKQLLSQNHESLMRRLNTLDEMLLKLASHLEGFKDIANVISPTSELSSQAVSILRQLDVSDSSSFLEVKIGGGSQYLFLDTSGSLDVKEVKFIEDDLSQLCKLNMLNLSHNSQGSRIFGITRFAVKYLATVDGEL